MKSSIRIYNNGNTIRATGNAAHELFMALSGLAGTPTAKEEKAIQEDVEKELGDNNAPCPQCGATAEHYMTCSLRDE